MRKGMMSDEQKAAMAEGRRRALAKKADVRLCDGCKKPFKKEELRPENPLSEKPDEKWFCFECTMARLDNVPEPRLQSEAEPVFWEGPEDDQGHGEPEPVASEPVASVVVKKEEESKAKAFGVYVASGTEENFRNLMRSLNEWQDKAYAKGVRDTLAWVLGDSPNAPTGKEVAT